MVNLKGVARLWAENLGSELAEDERELIQHMTTYILVRWKKRAAESTDSEVSFNKIYQSEKNHAMGLVCAVVEASRATAAGRNPREEMLKGLDRGMVH